MLNTDVQVLHCLTMFAPHCVEEQTVFLRIDQRQKSARCLTHISQEAEIEFASPAEVINPDVNLRDLGLGRQKLVVREISALEAATSRIHESRRRGEDPGRMSRVQMNAPRAPLTVFQDLKPDVCDFSLDRADDFIDGINQMKAFVNAGRLARPPKSS
jgi:hypothetical protein